MVSGLKTNRRGEGWQMKMLTLEPVATKGPSSGLWATFSILRTGEGENGLRRRVKTCIRQIEAFADLRYDQ